MKSFQLNLNFCCHHQGLLEERKGKHFIPTLCFIYLFLTMLSKVFEPKRKITQNLRNSIQFGDHGVAIWGYEDLSKVAFLLGNLWGYFCLFLSVWKLGNWDLWANLVMFLVAAAPRLALQKMIINDKKFLENHPLMVGFMQMRHRWKAIFEAYPKIR